ncbi:hypothetical protein BOVATA_004910 [Babesia ovata]|uniref:Secreted protein n=1 Tax=Babesia ovata TaxID=189622 RepID=A0A2H6K7P5_9APIC|nr:uncharacterized protein BOVATA_004910 [Babesia ovata]GBE58998.1 hypothetical protein BOVATA_004910 [Babesia ovata]
MRPTQRLRLDAFMVLAFSMFCSATEELFLAHQHLLDVHRRVGVNVFDIFLGTRKLIARGVRLRDVGGEDVQHIMRTARVEAFVREALCLDHRELAHRDFLAVVHYGAHHFAEVLGGLSSSVGRVEIDKRCRLGLECRGAFIRNDTAAFIVYGRRCIQVHNLIGAVVIRCFWSVNIRIERQRREDQLPQRHADITCQAENVLLDGLAGDAANEFSHDPPEVEVAVVRHANGFFVQISLLNVLYHGFVVQVLYEEDVGVRHHQPGGVVQHLPDGDLLLVILPEFRPMLADGVVQRDVVMRREVQDGSGYQPVHHVADLEERHGVDGPALVPSHRPVRQVHLNRSIANDTYLRRHQQAAVLRYRRIVHVVQRIAAVLVQNLQEGQPHLERDSIVAVLGDDLQQNGEEVRRVDDEILDEDAPLVVPFAGLLVFRDKVHRTVFRAEIHDLAEIGREDVQQRLEETLVTEVLVGRHVEARLNETHEAPYGITDAHSVGEVAQPNTLLGRQRLGHTPIKQHRVELVVHFAARQQHVSRVGVAVKLSRRQDLVYGKVLNVVHDARRIDVVILEKLDIGHLVELEELHGDHTLRAVLVENAWHHYGDAGHLSVHAGEPAALRLDFEIYFLQGRSRVIVDRCEHPLICAHTLGDPQNHL